MEEEDRAHLRNDDYEDGDDEEEEEGGSARGETGGGKRGAAKVNGNDGSTGGEKKKKKPEIKKAKIARIIKENEEKTKKLDQKRKSGKVGQQLDGASVSQSRMH